MRERERERAAQIRERERERERVKVLFWVDAAAGRHKIGEESEDARLH